MMRNPHEKVEHLMGKFCLWNLKKKKKKKKKKKRNSVHNYIKDSFLRAYIATNQFDIVCLTETFLDRYTQ